VFDSGWNYTAADTEAVKIKIHKACNIVTKPANFDVLSYDLQLNVIVFSDGLIDVFGNDSFLGNILIQVSGSQIIMSKLSHFSSYADFLNLGAFAFDTFHRVLETDVSKGFKFLCNLRLKSKSFGNLGRSFQDFFANALYKLRHDLVVSSLFKCLGMPFQREREIGAIFPALLDKTFRTKTPDIVLVNDLNVRIYEVTVSATPNEAARQKYSKYNEIAASIRMEYKVDVIFKVIAISPDFNGLTKSLHEIFPDNNDTSKHALEAAALCTSLQQKLNIAKPHFISMKRELKGDYDSGRLRYIEDMKVQLNPEARQMEMDLIKAIGSDPVYISKLDKLFADGNILPADLIPKEFEKQKPTHCTMQSLLDLGTSLPEKIARDYDHLEEAAPSLHLALPIGYLEYADTEGKVSEEDLTINLCEKIYTGGLNCGYSPAFSFLSTIITKVVKIKHNEPAYNIFVTGYPDSSTKQICKQHKEEIVQAYLEKKAVINSKPGEEVKYAYRILTDEERIAHLAYKEEVQRQKKESGSKEKTDKDKKNRNIMSFSRAKLLQCTQPREVLSLALHHKTICISEHFINARVFYEEAHVGMKKKELRKPIHTDEVRRSKSLIPDTQDHAVTENLLYEWSEPSLNPHIPAPDFLFSSDQCEDQITIMNLKQEIHKASTPALKTLLQTKWAEYSYRCHLFAQQMIHFGSYANRKGHFFLCNTGIKNVCCLVAGTNKKPSTDPGVPFLFFGTIPSNVMLTPLFGKVFYHQPEGKPYKIFITNWRRLKLEKLTHLRDVFFSTLASSFKNLCIPESITTHDIVETFGIRNLMGLSVSQKLAEFMADFKYISMASLSEFSKTDILIADKIKGPFTKHAEIYVLFQLIRSGLVTTASIQKNPITINEYYEDPNLDTEIDFSVGGTIALPYLWATSGIHEDYNNYLDSVHTYVHTIKEPASNFHESIKSLKTIFKFNNLYKEMTPEQRRGEHKTESDLDQLLDNNTMGFSARFLSDAMKHFISTTPIDYKKLLTSNVFFVPIAQFSSTKASIADPRRDPKETTRMKVIDAMIIDEMVNDDAFDIGNTLLEHAQMVVSRTELKPIADMCIKVQYGPKREFYVLDVYFKFALKFVEEFFKSVCKTLPTECISVPGDLKLLRLQELNKKIRQISAKEKTAQYFINGDCSKWSASELMESFGVIILELRSHLPTSVYRIFMNILALWKEKRLQIEPRLVDSLTQTKLTKDMFNEDGSPVYHLVLPQNFLMGLFNYLSSFKAVVVYDYIKHLLSTHLPKVTLKSLAHSDDYTFGGVFTSEQLVGIKTFITAAMRFGSITDSDKKTVVSNWYQEFVSLFTFNGVMTYPQIKKTKEVSSAITGMGYYQDASAVGSRTAEVMRCGCSNQVGLIFLKLHNWLLQNLYSLSKGQVNDIYRPLGISPFSVPVQAFGLTECWPLAYLISDGDPNNYRISRYYKNQNILLELTTKSRASFDQQIEGSLAVYSPDFLKTFTSMRLKKIKHLIKYDHAAATTFWEQHPSYKFLKPKYKPYLLDYLKSFFLLKSFTLAYTRQSKLATILRISSFVRRACIGYQTDPKLYTVKELMVKFANIHMSPPSSENSVIDPRFLTEGAIAPILFDQLMGSSHPKIGERDPSQYKSLASKMPKPYEQIHVDNNPADIIQFVYNNADYKLDQRQPIPNSSMEADANVVRTMDSNLLQMPLQERISFIYECLTKDKKRVRVALGPSAKQKDLIQFISDNFNHGFTARKSCSIRIDHAIKFDGPLGLTPIRFLYGGKHITKVHVICKTLITLAVYIRLKLEEKQNCLTHIIHHFTYLQIADENRSAYEFLNLLSLKQMEVNCLSEPEIQSMLLLQKICCLRADQLELYAMGYTSILFKYEKSAQIYIEGNQKGYRGDSIVSYSCFDATSRMLHVDDLKANILITNARSISKILMLYNVGTRFVDKKEFTEWESDKVLEKVAESFIPRNTLVEILEFYIGKTFFMDAFKQKWEILVKDEVGLYFRQINRSNFKDGKGMFLPVIFHPTLMSGPLDDAKQHVMSSDYIVDEKKWAVKTKSGNWTIAKLSVSDMYTNGEVFSNSNMFSFQHVNWDYLVQDCKITDIYLKSDTPHESDPNKLLNALNIEALPDIQIKDLFRMHALTKKQGTFSKYFPRTNEMLIELDFPALPKKEAPEEVFVTQDARSRSELGIVAFKTHEEAKKLLPGLEAALNNPKFNPDAKNPELFVKHLEEKRKGSKALYGNVIDEALKNESELFKDDESTDMLRQNSQPKKNNNTELNLGSEKRGEESKTNVGYKLESPLTEAEPVTYFEDEILAQASPDEGESEVGLKMEEPVFLGNPVEPSKTSFDGVLGKIDMSMFGNMFPPNKNNNKNPEDKGATAVPIEPKAKTTFGGVLGDIDMSSFGDMFSMKKTKDQKQTPKDVVDGELGEIDMSKFSKIPPIKGKEYKAEEKENKEILPIPTEPKTEKTFDGALGKIDMSMFGDMFAPKKVINRGETQTATPSFKENTNPKLQFEGALGKIDISSFGDMFSSKSNLKVEEPKTLSKNLNENMTTPIKDSVSLTPSPVIKPLKTEVKEEKLVKEAVFDGTENALDNENKLNTEYNMLRSEFDDALEQHVESLSDIRERHNKELLVTLKKDHESNQLSNSDLKDQRVIEKKLEENILAAYASNRNDLASKMENNLLKLRSKIERLSEPFIEPLLPMTRRERRKVIILEDKMDKIRSTIIKYEMQLAQFKADLVPPKSKIDSLHKLIEREEAKGEKLANEHKEMLRSHLPLCRRRTLQEDSFVRNFISWRNEKREKLILLSEKIHKVEKEEITAKNTALMKEGKISSLNLAITRIKDEINQKGLKYVEIIKTSFDIEDLDYFDQREQFAETDPKMRKIADRLTEIERLAFTAFTDHKKELKAIKLFIQNPSFINIPDPYPLDICFLRIPKAFQVGDGKDEPDFEENSVTVAFNRRIRNYDKKGDSKNIMMMKLFLIKDFQFSITGVTKNNLRVLDSLKLIELEDDLLKEEITLYLCKFFVNCILKCSKLYYDELVKNCILDYLKLELPNRQDFVILANFEDCKPMKRHYDESIRPFYSKANFELIAQLKTKVVGLPEIEPWFREKVSEFEKLPVNDAKEQLFLATLRKKQKELEYKQICKQIEDEESSFHEIQTTMFADPESMRAVKAFNKDKVTLNNEKRIRIDGLLKKLNALDAELQEYKNMLTPQIDEIKSFLTKGLNDDVFKNDIEKSAVKQDLTFVKLHGAYDMKPDVEHDGFKYLTNAINNKTKAWEDVMHTLNLIGMRNTIGYKTLLVIFVYLSITRFYALKGLNKIDAHIWNSTVDLLVNCNFSGQVECFPDKIGLCITLDNNRELKFYRCRRTDSYKLKRGEKNLGQSRLMMVAAWELPDSFSVEDELERYIDSLLYEEMRETLDIGRQNVMLKLIFKLSRLPHEDDV
jgi:hypothetical protein